MNQCRACPSSNPVPRGAGETKTADLSAGRRFLVTGCQMVSVADDALHLSIVQTEQVGARVEVTQIEAHPVLIHTCLNFAANRIGQGPSVLAVKVDLNVSIRRVGPRLQGGVGFLQDIQGGPCRAPAVNGAILRVDSR